MFPSRAATSGLVAILRAASAAGVVAGAPPSMLGAGTFGSARLLAARAPPNARARLPAHALGLGALTETTNYDALGACSSRLLAAGAPANPVAGLLAAASARPHALARNIDVGALATAAGAPAHAVAALDFATLAAAAYGLEVLTETLPIVLLAEDLRALAMAAGAPAHAVAASDPGVLAAALYGRDLRAGAPVSVSVSARLVAAGAPTSPEARLLAAAGARPHAVVDVVAGGALAAAAGDPAHAVVAYGPEVVTGARPFRSRVMSGTIFGRTGGVLHFPSRGGCGIRMLCTETGCGGGIQATMAAVSTAATKAELNDLRAEVLQQYLKSGKEMNKMWDEINALRVKTVETASRIVLSVYGLVGSFLLFVIPCIKGAWQADKVQVVDERQTKVDSQRDIIIEELSASFVTLTKLVEDVSLRQEQRDAAIAGVMEIVKQNGEKTEALAAVVAAAEKRKLEERAKDLERREKAMMAEREKLEEQKRAAARWF